MTSPPLNYTTVIAAARSVGDCQALLARAGADAVAVMYTDRQPSGLSFRLTTAHGARDFSMPINIDGVASLLRNADYPASVKTAQLARYCTREHATKVAWRVIKDWLEAQLALIAAQMATLDEIMLPYLQVESGQTLYQAYSKREQLALEAGR